MGPSAHVTATAALLDFRAMLNIFADEAKNALSMIDHEIGRALALVSESLAHWQSAARRAEDAVIQAKIELSQRRIQRIGDRQPDTSFQEKVLRRAQVDLDHALEKLESAKRWQRELPHEVLSFQGPARGLVNILECDVPRMAAFLDRKIAALETYARQTRE